MATLIDGKRKYVESDGTPVKFPQKYKTNKRTIAERERDLADVARYYLDGMTHQEIANALARERSYVLSRRMITKDVAVIWDRWRESYIRDTHELQMRELAKLDKLEGTYWEAWERVSQRQDYSQARQSS